MTATAERVVTFEALPVQQQLMDEIAGGTSRIIGFGGGIRGTKSWGSLASLIALCRIFPGSRWAVIRKDLQRLRDTTIPSFDKLRVRTGGFVSAVNQQRWESTCTNGSVILFRGENIDKDPELLRFHGYEVNGFLNEEADELSERTLVKEIERAGTWIIPDTDDQPPAYILNTFNPCATWPRRRFYLPWRDRTIQPPYAFIPTTAADNPYISDAQREAWKEMPANEYKRFVEGDWESLTGAYYDTLDPTCLIDRTDLPDVLPTRWRYWGAFDWGYAHWAVFGAWCTDEDGTDYLLDSVWMRKLQDDEMVPEIKRDVPPACLKLVYAGHDCWAKQKAHSASGVATAEVFAAHGIILEYADIDKVNGGRAVNRQLKQQRVKIVRTPGNLKLYDQLGEIMPDPIDIRKPDKVDADSEGVGGDDGADMFRYGIATRVAAARPPKEAFKAKDPDRAAPLIVKDGHLVPPVKVPTTAAGLADWAENRLRQSRSGQHRERLPRRTYR